MTNQLAKDLEIMFENYVEGFEAACVVSRNAKKFRPGDTAMQRAGDVLYRPQHYHMNIEEGLRPQQQNANSTGSAPCSFCVQGAEKHSVHSGCA